MEQEWSIYLNGEVQIIPCYASKACTQKLTTAYYSQKNSVVSVQKVTDKLVKKYFSTKGFCILKN